MKKLPKINSNFLTPLNKVVGEGSRVFVNSCKQLSPHVKLLLVIAVDEVAKKNEYAPDITAVKSNSSAPMSAIAKLFKMSDSYVYKLNKK